MRFLFLSALFLLFIGSMETFAQNQNNDNEKITALISKKRTYNKVIGFGYRIQLYNGNERRAKSLKMRFGLEFPSIYSKLKYDEPEWKVQVGNYKTTLEADKDLRKFRKRFSGIIVPMEK